MRFIISDQKERGVYNEKEKELAQDIIISDQKERGVYNTQIHSIMRKYNYIRPERERGL